MSRSHRRKRRKKEGKEGERVERVRREKKLQMSGQCQAIRFKLKKHQMPYTQGLLMHEMMWYLNRAQQTLC